MDTNAYERGRVDAFELLSDYSKTASEKKLTKYLEIAIRDTQKMIDLDRPDPEGSYHKGYLGLLQTIQKGD